MSWNLQSKKDGTLCLPSQVQRRDISLVIPYSCYTICFFSKLNQHQTKTNSPNPQRNKTKQNTWIIILSTLNNKFSEQTLIVLVRIARKQLFAQTHSSNVYEALCISKEESRPKSHKIASIFWSNFANTMLEKEYFRFTTFHGSEEFWFICIINPLLLRLCF